MDREDCLQRLRHRLANLLREARRLSNKDLTLYSEQRFIEIIYLINGLPRKYALVEIVTGDIYSRKQENIKGNIFAAPWYGFDVIDKHGAITNKHTRAIRIQQLVPQIGN